MKIVKKYKIIRKNHSFSRYFSNNKFLKSFINLSTIFFLGIPLLLLANVVLARTLSVADFGIFSFVLSLASVLAIPVAAGMPMLLTREVANYHKKNNWPAYRGILKVAYSWVVLATIGLGFAFVILKIFRLYKRNGVRPFVEF